MCEEIYCLQVVPQRLDETFSADVGRMENGIQERLRGRPCYHEPKAKGVLLE